MIKYLLFISFYFMFSKSLLEFGEFDLKVTNYETCRGPKRRNCSEIVTKIVDDIFLDIDINIKEAMKIVKGKLIGYLNGKALLRLEFKNLCNHIFLGPLIQGLFNHSEHCAIQKGHYRINLDTQAIARKFYGGKTIYGNWKINWIFHNEFCNLQCSNLYISVTPKVFAVGAKQ